jgi:short-subunit dehydrogenase
MLEKKEKRTERVAIINTGSFSGELGFAGVSMYSATKAFLNTFS